MIIGKDVFISKNTEITRSELCTIGNHVAIDSGFYCTTKLTIGDYVHISPHVAVIGGKHTGLTIEDFCFVSVGTKLVCGSEKFHGDGLIVPFIPDEYKDTLILKPIVMKRFSGVCAGSVVLPGVTMAEGSVLGASSMLKHDTEPWTIYVGSPARAIKPRKSETMIQYAKELGYDYTNI
jgi:acetyltransferase-like isoleucine patch superfamily enzyme